MSQQNVEVVKTVAPPSGTDLTSFFAEDSGAAERLEAIAPGQSPKMNRASAALPSSRSSRASA
jgi:hypothetical protein